jgi:hypothetical protein
MLIIEYSGDSIPARSAIRIYQSDYWILMDGSERFRLASGATIVDTATARNIIRRVRTLPVDHPLYGENIHDGPFPAGCLPGDVRMNEDGSWDCHVNGRWCSYSDVNGDRILTEE